MKIGYRTPSLKKSLSARTTGRVTRSVKSSANPLYGKKGMGLISNPKKSIYNSIYDKTTVGYHDMLSDNKNTIKSDLLILGIVCLVMLIIIGLPIFIMYNFLSSIFG